eukprot:2964303-Rhodomonas_salina.2
MSSFPFFAFASRTIEKRVWDEIRNSSSSAHASDLDRDADNGGDLAFRDLRSVCSVWKQCESVCACVQRLETVCKRVCKKPYEQCSGINTRV